MSIFSSIHADIANEKKVKWVKELDEAVKEKDWKKVKKVLRKMQRFYFSE